MRAQFLPFHVPDISEDEIQSVVETLRSGWLTTGSQGQASGSELPAGSLHCAPPQVEKAAKFWRFMMKKAENASEQTLELIQGMPLLNVTVIKDNGRYMANCPELDLITEMDTPEAAFIAIVEIIKEYAEDYQGREEIFIKSPNRAHHKPYVDRILECKDQWELYELIAVKYGHVHIR